MRRTGLQPRRHGAMVTEGFAHLAGPLGNLGLTGDIGFNDEVRMELAIICFQCPKSRCQAAPIWIIQYSSELNVILTGTIAVKAVPCLSCPGTQCSQNAAGD